MKYLIITAFLITSCARVNYPSNNREPSSIKKYCSDLLKKIIPKEEETAFEESRRAFLRGAAASVATASLGPGQLIKVAAQSAEAILPSRVAVLGRAAKLRKNITIQGTETYKEALIRASKQPEFSEVSKILVKRASQIQDTLGSDEILKKLPARILKEGTQKNPGAIFDVRIQRKLTESKIKSLKNATQQLSKIREDLLIHLEESMLYQIHLYEHLEIDAAALVHLVDTSLMKHYRRMLEKLAESSEDHNELYPKYDETVKAYLQELE